MTREDALTLVDHHVRIMHGGPDYVQQSDPKGVVVKVTDTQLFMRDPHDTQVQPRGWHLAAITKVHLLDEPLRSNARERRRLKVRGPGG